MKTMKLYLITFSSAHEDSLHHESKVTDDPAKAAWYYREYLDGLHALDYTRGSHEFNGKNSAFFSAADGRGNQYSVSCVIETLHPGQTRKFHIVFNYNGKHYERDVLEHDLDRNFMDEGYAYVFIHEYDTTKDGRYFEVNILKDENGEFKPEGYVNVFDHEDDSDYSDQIEDIGITIEWVQVPDVYEVRNDYYDEYLGKYCIDVYTDDDPDSPGVVAARVDGTTGKVEWVDSAFKTNPLVQESVQEVLDRIKEEEEEDNTGDSPAHNV